MTSPAPKKMRPKPGSRGEKAQKRASTAASFMGPEAKAAKVAASAKLSAAKATSKAGEKGARKLTESQKARQLQKKRQGISAEQKKREAAKKAAPKTRTQRATTATRQAGERRVASAKESRRKTASAVEGKYRRDKVVGLAEMRPKVRMLAAEYMAAILLAIILLFVPSDRTYHEKMSRFFVQMTGISGIFFILALASSSEKTSRWAIPFGLLIDISMLAFVFKQGASKAINAALGGKVGENLPPGSQEGSGGQTPGGLENLQPGPEGSGGQSPGGVNWDEFYSVPQPKPEPVVPGLPLNPEPFKNPVGGPVA